MIAVSSFGWDFPPGVTHQASDEYLFLALSGDQERALQTDTPTKASNTKITYFYRDGNNNKQWQSAIVQGTLTFAEIEAFLSQGLYFIPGQVGLEDLQARFHDQLTADDHAWHELYRENMEPTLTHPTLSLTAQELLARFQAVQWDERAACHGLGIPHEAAPQQQTTPQEVKEILSSRQIGWQERRDGRQTAVIEATVLFSDESQGIRWALLEPRKIEVSTSDLLDACPSIDWF